MTPSKVVISTSFRTVGTSPILFSKHSCSREACGGEDVWEWSVTSSVRSHSIVVDCKGTGLDWCALVEDSKGTALEWCTLEE